MSKGYNFTGSLPKYTWFIHGKEYDNINDAAQAENVKKSTISKWVKSEKHLDCYKEKKGEKLTDQAVINGAIKENKTPLQFLLDTMNDTSQKPNIRLQAANWAAPYMHEKADSKKGKKEEQTERAKEISKTRFKPWDSPLKVVK